VVEPEIRAVAPEAGIDVSVFAEVPPLRPEPNGAAERLARSLTGDDGLHVVSFAAEAGQYQAAGFPTVLCGPGSIDQAHQPNEFISLEQVTAGVAFLRCLITRLAA
jgi:acetylornithine deacetylase